MPYPLPLTRTEAYLAYKAGVIQQSDLKPSLAIPRNGIDAWLAYWTGLTPTYPVKNVGKNLFNAAAAINNHWLNYQTGKLINDSNPNVVSNFIEVTSGTTYTISGADDLRIDVWQYAAQDENTGTARIVLLANKPHTFTPNTPWIRFAVGSGDAISIKNQFMLEAGSTATSFEPYTGEPLTLQEEEAYIAYLSGVANEYPEKCLRRVGAYLRYLISARWGRPDRPLNREELYLSLIKTQFIPSGDPSSDITIDGTTKAQFVDVKMYGDTFQQSYTGKNLIDMPIVSGSRNGVTWVVNDDGSITLNGTATGNVGIRAEGARIPAVAGETYTLSATGLQDIVNFGYKNIRNGTDILIVTHDSPVKTVQITEEMLTNANRLDMFFVTGASFNNQRVTLQLEKGSTATAYEPYVGGTPAPNPDYPQAIQTVTGEQTVTVVGKNLFNATGTTIYGGYFKAAGSISGYQYPIGNQKDRWFYIPCLPNTTYTITKPVVDPIENNRFRVGTSAEVPVNGTELSDFYNAGDGTSTATYTFTTSATANYLCVYYGSLTTADPTNVLQTVLNGIQIEIGATATTYAPYHATNYPISLGSIELCKLGTYQDYIYKDGDSWKVHKETAKQAMGDITGYTKGSGGSDGTRWLRINFATAYNAVAGGTCISNCLLYKSATQWSGDTFGIAASGNLWIGLDNAQSSLSEWLSSIGAVMYYPLATATDTEITNTALIAQLEALVAGGAENGTTYIKVNATDPNLPGLLYVEAPKYE